jgi:hypothetical protein
MVDPKGTDSKPAENKSGPVKPPVIDLKARETAAEKPGEPTKPEPDKTVRDKPSASETAPKAAPPTPPIPPKAQNKPANTILPAIAGGVLGLAGAYGLALAGLWPSAPLPVAPEDNRIAQFASAIPEVKTIAETTQSELSTLTTRVTALESLGSSDTAPGLSTIETDVAALAARIDRLASTPAAAPQPSGELDALRNELAALSTRFEEIGARLGNTEAQVRTLDSAVTKATATLADQPSDIGAVLQLPLILSGFETAFATGRGYETELAALRAAMPGATIPPDISNNAKTGLVRPDVIAARFAEVLPAMLAGRPANPHAQWQDGALDWFRSAIALRPAGEVEGDDPEAVMTRLDGAIARRDFAQAESLLETLPTPMVTAGGDVVRLIKTQAEASRFLDGLRNTALSGEVQK